MSGGGVGRNICESLSKLGCRPIFLSVLGDDPQGKILSNFIPEDNFRRVKILKGRNTGQCTIVLDRNGECKFLVGDMEIHQHLTPEMVCVFFLFALVGDNLVAKTGEKCVWDSGSFIIVLRWCLINFRKIIACVVGKIRKLKIRVVETDFRD